MLSSFHAAPLRKSGRFYNSYMKSSQISHNKQYILTQNNNKKYLIKKLYSDFFGGVEETLMYSFMLKNSKISQIGSLYSKRYYLRKNYNILISVLVLNPQQYSRGKYSKFKINI